MVRLTIFDLDNTLLAGDSDYAWGQFIVDKGLVNREEYLEKNNHFYLKYQQGTLDIHEYQRFVLTPLIRLDCEQRENLRQEFLVEVVGSLRLPKADALIRHHQNLGDQVMIITATNRFIAGPIGPLLGIDTMLATEPEVINDKFTGAIAGIPCFQEGKITRLREWLQAQGVEPTQLTFYSDSINDLPLLEYSDKAIAVDPDESLKRHAHRLGWPIISLRD
ncbi:MAG: HAD superfamily hydrolase (TIGR01490 family) [Cellvibrionaceae bacterium]|jgi:HAD superfamily hydrolase (TIGR01490 family)